MTATRPAVEKAQTEANAAKDRLLSIARSLEAVGAKRKAASLLRIVARLERWQNTP